MRFLVLMLACLLLTGCPSGNAPTPPPTAACLINSLGKFPLAKVHHDSTGRDFCYDDSEAKADITQLPILYDKALLQTSTIRPNVNLDTLFPLSDTIFKLMPTQMTGIDGNPGFYADSILDQVAVAKIKELYPTSTDAAGRLGLSGYTDVSGTPLTIYAVAANLPVVRHESLHLIWYAFFGGESCPNSLVQTWSIVEHGVLCDPFIK